MPRRPFRGCHGHGRQVLVQDAPGPLKQGAVGRERGQRVKHVANPRVDSGRAEHLDGLVVVQRALQAATEGVLSLPVPVADQFSGAQPLDGPAQRDCVVTKRAPAVLAAVPVPRPARALPAAQIQAALGGQAREEALHRFAHEDRLVPSRVGEVLSECPEAHRAVVERAVEVVGLVGHFRAHGHLQLLKEPLELRPCDLLDVAEDEAQFGQDDEVKGRRAHCELRNLHPRGGPRVMDAAGRSCAMDSPSNVRGCCTTQRLHLLRGRSIHWRPHNHRPG
mmetsp:Transcript_1975/g.6538  ORF Transcript_1975/g.6538 Transcript_1975/m.6538 type:complete len:278 (+) Transcript_1975:461-1294(+)